MKNNATAEKVKSHIKAYIRCYQENKRSNPPYLALSNYQLEKLGLYGDSGTIFNLPWRRHP
jgi:hypothetical protein